MEFNVKKCKIMRIGQNNPEYNYRRVGYYREYRIIGMKKDKNR